MASDLPSTALDRPIPARPKWFWMLGLFGFVVLSFAALARNDFVDWDDTDTIVANPDFTSPRSGLPGYLSEPRGHLYIPITYAIWDVLWRISRTLGSQSANPTVFHLASLIVHALTSVVVFSLLRRLIGGRAPAALLGALMFALHPLQVETVAWASGMKDLLAGLFGMTSLLLFVCFLQSHDNPRARRAAIVLATLAFAAALLSKPTAAALPLPAAAIALLAMRRSIREIAAPLMLWLLIALAVVIVGKFAQPAPNAYRPPLLLRPLVAGDALAFYVGKLVAPVDLVVDYARAPQHVLQTSQKRVNWLAPVAVGLIAWRVAKRRPGVDAAALIFPAALLPVLGIVPFEYQAYSTVADHYVYVAMLGPALVLALLLCAAGARGYIAAGCLLILLGGLSVRQMLLWHDSTTLFAHNLKLHPDSIGSHRALAFVSARAGNAPQAAAHYQAILQIDPDDAAAHYNLANLLLNSRPDLAAEHYRAALNKMNTDWRVHNNYGIALFKLNRADEAMAQFEAVLSIDPNSPDGHTNLARVLIARGQTKLAGEHLHAALHINPDFTPARRMLETTTSPTTNP